MRIPLLTLVLCCGVVAAAPRFDLLVQGAVDTELQPILAALQNKKQVQIRAWTFWTGRIGRKSVVVSRTEVGPINAVASTIIAIERFRPGAIVNQGTAGAHNPSLRLWDIVVSEKATDYGAFKSVHGDQGQGVQLERWTPIPHRLRINGLDLIEFRSFPADSKLADAALRVPYRRGRVLKGNIGSAYQFNRELDYIAWMHKTFGTDTEDMESAFVAGAAAAMGVPFVAIRIVSDSEWNHPTFEKIAGEYCAAFVADFVRSLR
ncbi:MAG: 5'-methylthioadenosine/S-adenosylhomocysteine nucleosidase [Bryobacteraceae bacterium]